MKKLIKNLLNVKDLNEFLIKQYEENWKYIRHIEEVRLKHMHLYIIFTGGILTVIASIIFSGSNKVISLDKLIIDYFFILFFILFVIYMYGLFLIIFLIKQKRGYDMYVQKNKNIEKYFWKDYKIENLKSKFIKEMNSSFKKTFFYWLAIVIAIHSAFFSLMVYTSAFFLMKNSIFSFLLSLPSFFFNFILLSLIYKNNTLSEK